MMRKAVYIILYAAVTVLLVRSAQAGRIPLEVTQASAPDYFYPVEGKYAGACWISDFKKSSQQYLLVIQDTKLILHKLNRMGEVEGSPAELSIKKPQQFKPERLHVRSAAFHPIKPLLYVWRDLSGNHQNHSPNELIFNEFRHLLVYSIANGKFDPLTETAAGDQYAFTTARTPIAVDPEGRRLYVSAVQKDSERYEDAFTECAGYIELDDAGLPVIKEGKAKLIIKDTKLRYPDYWLGARPNGYQWREGKYSLHPLQDDYIVFSTKHDLHLLYMGKGTPETPEEIRFDLLTYGRAHFCVCVPHPSQQVVYVRSMNQLYYIQLLNFRLTLLPQYLQIEEQFSTPPHVVGHARRVAVGRTNGTMMLAEIDKYGRLTGNAEVVDQPANCMTYSRRFEKLYVIVDEIQESNQ